MRHAKVAAALFFLMAVILVTSLIYRHIMDISMPRQRITTANLISSVPEKQDTVYVGVISRFSPNLLYEGYQPIIDYLNGTTSHHFALKLSNSYEQTVTQIEQDQIQAAFLGTFLYLKVRKEHDIQCILKPLNSQFEPHFQSVIVTRSDSPISSIKDLAGKKLALPSPLSFSGNWVVNYEFQKHGLKINDLDSVHYFGFHHTVIYQVLRGNFDAGVVKDRVAEEFLNKGIRILAASEPIPGSPIIVKKSLDASITMALKEALLKIDVHKPEYRDLVRHWDPEFAYGFALAKDQDYDEIEAKIGTSEALP